MAEQIAIAAPDNLPTVIPTKVTGPTDLQTRRPARSRVANVLKRLRKQNPRNALRRFSRTDTETTLDRLDEKAPSEISELTDIFHDDDLTLDNGKIPIKEDEKQTKNADPLEPSQCRAPSSMASLSARSSTLKDYTLSESLGAWLESFACLAKSKEMDSFLNSSNALAASATQSTIDVAKNVGGLVVHTALLPVTLPIQATATATDLLFSKGSNVLHYFCDNVVPLVVSQTVKIPKNPLIMTKDPTTPKIHEYKSLSRIKKTSESTITDTNNIDEDDFLERLRLDLHSDSVQCAGQRSKERHYTRSSASEAVYSVDTDFWATQTTKTKFSILLLRVEDIQLTMKPQEASESESESHIVCVDLHEDFSDEQLVSDALALLSVRSIEIESSNEAVSDLSPSANREEPAQKMSIQIDWKALGQTKKDYKRLKNLSESEFYDALCSRVLTWSGKYLGPKYYGSENPFFYARGIVNGEPEDVLNLLWDSKRTNEYNKHCVSREDKFSIFDYENNTTNGFYGAKIIESETKIPMTKMSVRLSALMCAKFLGESPEDGYVIFSRSLSCGEAGNHLVDSGKLCQNGNNEVIIGINIMRPVPGRPGLSDLISISQVDASILPPFLKARVGIMAAEDFFKNARKALK